MEATLLRLFGTKIKAFTAVFSVVVLICVSEILRGTTGEYIMLGMALIVPVILSMLNRTTPKDPQETKKDGLGIMKVGVILFAIGTLIQLLIKFFES